MIPSDRFPLPLHGEVLSASMGGRVFALIAPFVFVPSDATRDPVSVPAGYVTDFASIPRFFWRVLPPMGKYSHAAVIHDYLCDFKPCDHKEAAWIFRDAMKALGVGAAKRNLMYRAVLWFGPRFEAAASAQVEEAV